MKYQTIKAVYPAKKNSVSLPKNLVSHTSGDTQEDNSIHFSVETFPEHIQQHLINTKEHQSLLATVERLFGTGK